MKDNLEKFMREHQPEFDLFEPDEGLWQGIEEKIDKKKTRTLKFYVKRVAAVAAIFIASFVLQQLLFSESKIKFSIKSKKVEIDIPELKEAELYYTGLINAKLDEAKPMLNQFPSLEEELKRDLTELDSIYYSLKEDLKDDVANEEVLEAMIQNYRLRIDILEDMLSFLDEQNSETNINNTGYDL